MCSGYADAQNLLNQLGKRVQKKVTEKVTVKKGKTVKATVKGLKKKKTFYVKIRGYKTVNNKKVYGAFSAVKSKKVR